MTKVIYPEYVKCPDCERVLKKRRRISYGEAGKYGVFYECDNPKCSVYRIIYYKGKIKIIRCSK